jgi:hypothetical protein
LEDTLAVFYDPVTIHRIGPKASNNENAQTELRNQVNDFLRWLKAQGIM